jgi:hypothetical protein
MIIVTCPHCEQLIEIVAVNCAIFRCGEYKANGQQLPPHLPKEECDRLFSTGQIWGCGKPFRLEPKGTTTAEYIAVCCDYI